MSVPLSWGFGFTGRGTIWLAGVALAIAAAGFAWRWGPAENGAFDSAFYLDGARHLAAGEGYVSAYVEAGRNEYEPITHWAPGTSVLIASLIKLGASPLTAASVVLGACYVAAVVLVFAIGVQVAGTPYWALSMLVAALFALQSGTLVALDFVLSDLPCATFMLLALWLALRLTRTEHPSLALRVALGVCIVWTDLVRYAGLLFIPGMLVATVLAMRARPFWRRVLSMWPTVLIAGLGVAAWNVRNKRVADKPLGGWTFVDSDVTQHMWRASRAAFIWVNDLTQEAASLGLDRALQWLLYAAGVSFLVLAVVSVRRAWRELGVVGLTVAGYAALIIATASVTLIAPLNETRFWVGVWPLEFLLVLIAVAHAGPRWCVVPRAIAVVALVCGVGLYAVKGYRELGWARQPRGLLSSAWANATQVLPGPDACRLYVNDPRPYMMNRALPPTSEIPTTLEAFDAALKPGEPVCVAVSIQHPRLRLSTSAERRRIEQTKVVDALLAQKRLEKVARRNGVIVYRLR